MEPEGGYLLDGRLWSDEEKLSLTLVRHSDSVLESGTKPRGHQGSPSATGALFNLQIARITRPPSC